MGLICFIRYNRRQAAKFDDNGNESHKSFGQDSEKHVAGI